MDTTAQEIGDLLRKRRLTFAAVESATGGLISHLITDVPGSSDYYQGSITAYSNEIKMRLLGVKKETLEKYGAVSGEVAEEMASGGRRVLRVDICVADTGIAGPTGASKNKPIGLFYLGLSHKDGTHNRKHIFKGNREQNKELAAQAALGWVKDYLNSVDVFRSKVSPVRITVVVTAFLESNGKVLLLRRSQNVGTYKGLWAGVSGYVETPPDEQVLTEIKEEAGLGPASVKLLWKGQAVDVEDEKVKTHWIIHPYLFKVKDPGQIKIDWEHTESRWIKPSEIDNYPTVPKLKEALEAVNRAG